MFWNRTKKRQKMFPDVGREQQSMIGKSLNFSASEAYKLLRTNLIFSFPEEKIGRIVGVTSSFKGEGKSITTINLAYTIAQTGKRVLLIECDLRIPTVAKRLNLRVVPGLSNLLVGLSELEDVIQHGVMLNTLDVMVAGDIPPNAAELLESEHMKSLLSHLAPQYDYILLDLPPVTVVSDALIVSKVAQGMVVVVRQEYASKSGLAQTMRQLNHANAKVLGFVFNSVSDGAGSYRKYGKYGQKSYGGEYGYGGQSGISNQ